MKGDFGVARTDTFLGFLIRLFTFSHWNHAFIDMGKGWCVEATMEGAKLRTMTYKDMRLSPQALSWEQRLRISDAALGVLGTPYGFADILALALLRLHIRPVWLRREVARTDRLICSQLVDVVYRRAGVSLFKDGRSPENVTPGDLSKLIGEGNGW